MKFTRLNKAYRFFINKIRLSFKEKHLGKLKYIHERNGSDELIIMFSGFGTVRKYNYMKTLAQSSIDKLFILDSFGYRGSYYWYENGEDEPNVLVSRLIEQIRGGYKSIYTAGSSKGGTCAIYYGLKFNVKEVFSSACQYHVGDYLNTEDHRRVMEGMMGKNYCSDDVKRVNEELPKMIKEKTQSRTLINLYYSEKDHTYEDHIVDLKRDLDAAGIHYTITTDDYVKHSDNGFFFKEHLKRRFCR